MENWRQLIQSAIGSGLAFEVVYLNEKRQENTGEIVPLLVDSYNVVYWCVKEKKEKKLDLKKIVNINKNILEKYGTFAETYNDCYMLNLFVRRDKKRIESLGWYIELFYNVAEVYKMFGSDKKAKIPEASIGFNEYKICMEYDDVIDDFVKKRVEKREKPWIVWINNSLLKSFSTLDQAWNEFMSGLIYKK